jgi:hypothetical protein
MIAIVAGNGASDTHRERENHDVAGNIRATEASCKIAASVSESRLVDKWKTSLCVIRTAPRSLLEKVHVSKLQWWRSYPDWEQACERNSPHAALLSSIQVISLGDDLGVCTLEAASYRTWRFHCLPLSRQLMVILWVDGDTLSWWSYFQLMVILSVDGDTFSWWWYLLTFSGSQPSAERSRIVLIQTDRQRIDSSGERSCYSYACSDVWTQTKELLSPLYSVFIHLYSFFSLCTQLFLILFIYWSSPLLFW